MKNFVQHFPLRSRNRVIKRKKKRTQNLRGSNNN